MVPYHERAESTFCLSTGRALDCSVRKRYSGQEYVAFKAVGNFVGDGQPAILAQTMTYPANVRPTPSGDIQMCRIMGDDTSGGASANDHNMGCYSWPGVQLPVEDPMSTTDQAYFMDLLGTGRPQLVYYHSGMMSDGSWNEDGRWEVFEPLDVATDGEALDKLVSVRNGLGATSSVTYSDGLSSGIVGRTPDTAYAYPIRYSPTPGKIVSRLTVSVNGSDSRSVSYQYRDGATDVSGRGALGFGMVIKTDENSGVVTTTKLSQTFPHTGTILWSKDMATCQLSAGSIQPETQLIHHPSGARTLFP